MSRSNAKKIMSMTNKNVVCIRWGMKYGAHYVNRLYGMVARHLTPPFRFRVGKLKPLQDAFRADPQGIADRYRYEQRLVSREAPGGVRFWPRRWVSNFKQHCQRPFPVNYFWEPRLPADCRVVIFPGKVSPHHAIEGVWGDGREVKSRTEYIRWALMPKNERRQPIRHLRHYFIPPKWLTEHWRE